MYAYNEAYLNSAVSAFAEMVEYAVHDRGIPGDEFMAMLLVSGVAKRFGRGDLRYVAGRSGIEIADEVIQRAGGRGDCVSPSHRMGKTPEYWAAWALAQYQWHTARPYDDILRLLPFSDIVRLYPTLHEADITKFYHVVNALLAEKHPPTNLKRIRTAAGLSQSGLSAESGVSLRSIQMFEQRNKDINKAQALTLAALSRTLGCGMEDLLEPKT